MGKENPVWRYQMCKKRDGIVSDSLLSLQLQLQSVLEEAGGDEALTLLDRLAELSTSEQKSALALFQKVVEKMLSSEKRYLPAEEAELKNFEDGLYNDIVTAMEAAERHQVKKALSADSEPKLEVLDGGKSAPLFEPKPAKPTPIDFNSARKGRKLRSTNCMN
jgi:hypothetical protein